jgi:molybdopterin converting factor small subunit
VQRSFPSLKLDAMRFAVGTEYARPDTPVRADDVVSFLPPVGGG